MYIEIANKKKINAKYNNIITILMMQNTITYIVIAILATIIIYQLYGYFNPPNRTRQIIYFSSSHCGHCMQFQPIWDRFVQNYAYTNPNIQLIQIDTNQINYELVNMYNIQGFPTILATQNNQEIMKFTGPRTYANLIYFYNSLW